MANLLVSETYINRSEGYSFGESDVIESFTADAGELFRSCQKEYGRCTSKVYVDGADGAPKPIGWVFLKSMQYEDTHEPYLREVWVTLHDAKPETAITHHFHELKS